MTRKDYVLIASAINDIREKIRMHGRDVASRELWSGTLGGISDAARAIADALQADNPRFDRERFLKAAGVKV